MQLGLKMQTLQFFEELQRTRMMTTLRVEEKIDEDSCWSFVDDLGAYPLICLGCLHDPPDDELDGVHENGNDAADAQRRKEDNVGVLFEEQPRPCFLLRM